MPGAGLFEGGAGQVAKAPVPGGVEEEVPRDPGPPAEADVLADHAADRPVRDLGLVHPTPEQERDVRLGPDHPELAAVVEYLGALGVLRVAPSLGDELHDHVTDPRIRLLVHVPLGPDPDLGA